MTTFGGGLDAARHALREHFGHRSFRIHQLRVIGPLLAGLDVLAVLPTGAGKSLCFQLPALMADGLTLVISPLISLMQNQVGAMRRRGIAAAYVNGLLAPDQRRTILEAALAGRLKLLYCAPERLASLVRRLTREEADTPEEIGLGDGARRHERPRSEQPAAVPDLNLAERLAAADRQRDRTGRERTHHQRLVDAVHAHERLRGDEVDGP